MAWRATRSVGGAKPPSASTEADATTVRIAEGCRKLPWREQESPRFDARATIAEHRAERRRRHVGGGKRAPRRARGASDLDVSPRREVDVVGTATNDVVDNVYRLDTTLEIPVRVGTPAHTFARGRRCRLSSAPRPPPRVSRRDPDFDPFSGLPRPAPPRARRPARLFVPRGGVPRSRMILETRGALRRAPGRDRHARRVHRRGRPGSNLRQRVRRRRTHRGGARHLRLHRRRLRRHPSRVLATQLARARTREDRKRSTNPRSGSSTNPSAPPPRRPPRTSPKRRDERW